MLILAIGTLRGLDPLLAQAWGAGDRARLAAGIGGAVRLAVAMSVPIIGWHALAGPGLRLLGQPTEILPDAAAYCGMVALGVLPQLVFAAIGQGLQGMGRMRSPMIAVIVANLANVLLDGTLMLGWFGVPSLGATGCGIATTGSRFVMLGVLLLASARALAPLRALDVPATAWWALLRLGWPVGVQTSLEVWAFHIIGIFAGWLGPAPLAAHAVALSITSVTFMIPLGLGAAAATRVGNLIGAGYTWGRSGAVAVLSGAAVMTWSGLMLLAAPSQLAGLYTDDAAVIALAIAVLPIAAGFQVFDGIQVVAFGVLRGVGDVRLPSLANVVAYYLLGLPLAYVLGVRGGFGLPGLWLGLAVSLLVVATLLLTRLRQLATRGAVPPATG